MPSGCTRYGVPSGMHQGVAHDRVLLGGLHQREGDEMGEGDLPASPRRLERRVEPRAPLLEHRRPAAPGRWWPWGP